MCALGCKEVERKIRGLEDGIHVPCTGSCDGRNILGHCLGRRLPRRYNAVTVQQRDYFEIILLSQEVHLIDANLLCDMRYVGVVPACRERTAAVQGGIAGQQSTGVVVVPTGQQH